MEENPFQPPTDVAAPILEAAEMSPKSSWQRVVFTWTLVCWVSAVPSFYWGWATIAQSQLLAMSLGIWIFVFFYISLDLATQNRSWRNSQPLRLAMRIAYGTRLAVSIIFPVGGFLDLVCGMFSVGIAETFMQLTALSEGNYEDSADFWATLAVTLVQGCVLNVVVAAFMLVVFGIILVVQKSGR